MADIVKFPGTQVRDTAGLDPALHPKVFILVGIKDKELSIQYFSDVFACLKAVDDLDDKTPLHFAGWCLQDGPEALAAGLNHIEQTRKSWPTKS